jgi:hypothetical protein
MKYVVLIFALLVAAWFTTLAYYTPSSLDHITLVTICDEPVGVLLNTSPPVWIADGVDNSEETLARTEAAFVAGNSKQLNLWHPSCQLST